MGTNYYKVFIPTEQQLADLQKDLFKLREIKNGVSNEDIETVKGNIRETLDEKPNVHICKMSYGWKTNFDHNWGKYYGLTKKSIDNFLRQPDGYLVDEYGEKQDIDEFWKKVAERDALPDACTIESYRKRHPEERNYYCYEDRNRVNEVFGFMPKDDDFESDGLRFAVFSDFS